MLSHCLNFSCNTYFCLFVLIVLFDFCRSCFSFCKKTLRHTTALFEKGGRKKWKTQESFPTWRYWFTICDNLLFLNTWKKKKSRVFTRIWWNKRCCTHFFFVWHNLSLPDWVEQRFLFLLPERGSAWLSSWKDESSSSVAYFRCPPQWLLWLLLFSSAW